MDVAIPRKTWTVTRLASFIVIGLVGVILAYLVFRTGGSSLTIDPDRVAIAEVKVGEFEEYVPITGVVQPKTTVFLDLEEGGIVEHISIESGVFVNRGDLILTFSNTAVQKNNIDSETRLLENLDALRNSRISLTEKALILKDQLLDVNFRISELERTFARYERLRQTESASLPLEQFESVRDQLTYYREKRTLLESRIEQESVLREQQSQQVDDSIGRVNRSLAILGRMFESLELRAPIDGYLSSMNAEIGQNFVRGQRIGQIDQLDSFKVRSNVDQFYISRVTEGLGARFDFGGRNYQLRIGKIYPEVTNSSFQIDLEFAGEVPDGIKRGQSLQIDLSLSESKTTHLVAKGGFYRHTNGRWVYRLDADGASARRVDVVPGRQNPESFEVLDGLEPGDWIISSSYDAYQDVDELSFSSPIRGR
jgi:HlyD family secretion protein